MIADGYSPTQIGAVGEMPNEKRVSIWFLRRAEGIVRFIVASEQFPVVTMIVVRVDFR